MPQRFSRLRRSRKLVVSFYRNTELIMFDIRLSDEQRAFQQLAREFAENEIKPIALDLDSRPNWEDRIPWDVLKKGSPLGFRLFVRQEEKGRVGGSDYLPGF